MAAKSLQDLSASKSLEEILDLDKPEAFFAELEPRAQELVFAQLVKDHRRLKGIEKEHETIQRAVGRVPLADRFVHLDPDFRKRLPIKGPKTVLAPANAGAATTGDTLQPSNYIQDAEEHPSVDTGREEEEEDDDDPLRKARAFQRTWKYIDPDEKNNPMIKRGYWHLDSSLMGVSPESGRVEGFIYGVGMADLVWEHGWTWTHNVISSQLLLYRLILTFGEPYVSLREDGFNYKTQWEVELVLRDPIGGRDKYGRPNTGGVDAKVQFYDQKGGCGIQIEGTEKGTEMALELVNYLVGRDCAHPYDGVLAGRIA